MKGNFKWLKWKAENLPDKVSAKQMLKFLKESEEEIREHIELWKRSNQIGRHIIQAELKEFLGE